MVVRAVVPMPLACLASATHMISPRTMLSPAMVRSNNPPLLTQPYNSKASDSGETASTSVGSAISWRQQQLPLDLERRLACLEEEMIAVHRRLSSGDGKCTGEAVVLQEDGESMQVHPLAGEPDSERARQLEARLAGLEAALEKDRQERVAQFASLTGEVANTMRALMKRIDEGLAAGAFTPTPPTASVIDAATEERLRSLITRVDLGLATGAAALRDTLKGAGIGEDALPSQRLRPSGMVRSTVHSPTQSRSPSKGARPSSTTSASTGILRPAIVRSPSRGPGPLPLATDSVRTLSPRASGTSILVSSPGKAIATGLLSPRIASPAFPLFSMSQGSSSVLSSIRGRTSPPIAGGVVRSTSEVSRASVAMLRSLP